MNPEWIVAVCSLITLLILWTTTVFGGAFWLQRQLKALKIEILQDFDVKHNDNAKTVKALEALVMRHDIVLNPEFNGTGRQSARHQ